MKRRVSWAAVLALSALTLAGCLGDDPVPEPEAPAPERPGTLAAPSDATLSQTGRWLEPFDGEVPAVNMVQLHDGRVIYWSGLDASEGATETEVLGVNGPYPAQGESRILEFTDDGFLVTTPGEPTGGGFDLFCSGQSILPDGRIVIAGGTEWEWIPDGTVGIRGVPDTRIFDPATSNWTTTDDMLLGRWYPSIITASDGSIFSIGGIGHWVDPTEHWDTWEAFDAQGEAWSGVPSVSKVLPLYPRVYEVAGGPLKGEFFVDTIGALWAPFGEHQEQSDWAYQWSVNVDTGAWSNLGLSQYGARSYAGHAMLQLDPARDHAPEFLTMGGTLYQSIFGVPFAERTDLSTNPPTRITVPDMAANRWHPMAVVLTDGDVLTLGGSLYDNVALYSFPTLPPIYDVELFDPDSNTWSNVAPMDVERVYHSTAMLLPDGRVIAGGHVPDPNYFGAGRKYVNPQPYETRLQIYEPGYLFRGDRPVIVDAPEAIGYGESFTVDLELPSDLDSLLLVRPGATTHTYDGSVRHILLETAPGNGTNVTAMAPPDGVVAPPGHYMLFANAAHPDGAVPSEAVWVTIG